MIYSLDTFQKYSCFDSDENTHGLFAVSDDLDSLMVALPYKNDGKSSVIIHSYTDKAIDGAFRWYMSE